MTSEELIRTGHIWKNIHGSWSRFCPQCKSVIDYIGISDRRMKDACRKAHIKQCVCAKCRTANKVGVELKPPPTGVWKSERNNWCRTCLKCCETVIHKGKKAKSKCILAFNAQRLCKVCSITRTKELPEGIWDDNECWCRKCPKCNQIIKYPHDKWAKYTCIKGLGKLCKVCSGVESSKKQIGQKRSSQWCKNIGNSKRGPKNPWFGKKRSPEFCKIVSEANKGKKNPWWGKTRPSDLVHRTMLAIEKSKYKRKEYTFPDGHKSLVQGYEPQTLDCLIA